MKVHSVNKGTLNIPLPERVCEGTTGQRLQGGLPPVAYRSSTAKWGAGNQQHSAPRNKAPGRDYTYLQGYVSFINGGRRDL